MSASYRLETLLPERTQAALPRPTSAWVERPRVLIVDPAQAMSLVLGAWLPALGYLVTLETSLEGALAACRRERPHLLIAYRSLRGGTAQQLSEQLRRDAQLRQIAMLYVTALDDSRDLRAALAAGADDYHQIPFDIDRLYEQIRALLAHSQGWLLPPALSDFRPL